VTTADGLRSSSLWHPFADMARVAGHEVIMARGEGVWLWDVSGRAYLDACAGLWHTNIGHGRPEIAAAVARQFELLETHHVFNDYANEPALALAERLAGLAPQAGSKLFFTSGGGDAIDSAAKLARLYWTRLGAPERRHIVNRHGGYHGTHGFGTSLAGIPANQEGFGPLIADVSGVPYDSPEALDQEILRVGPERVAAFVLEPVIASGGVLPPPPGYIEAVDEVCRRHGVLTIADCVVAGFGRLGCWYGVERFHFEPDLIVFAKGVTSGYLPLGGLVVAPRVAEPFYSVPGGLSFRHGPTYSGHAAACAAAMANLDILGGEGLLARSNALEGPLLEELAKLGDHPFVAETRGGVGLMAALDLRADLVERHPSLPMDALAAARAAGVLTRPLERGLGVAPPLVIDAAELPLIGVGLRRGLDALAELLEAGVPLPLEPDVLAGLHERVEALT
jgi:putrescine---pyruvate transaminase